MSRLLNSPVDISAKFKNFENHYFIASHISSFNPETAMGIVVFKRNTRKLRLAFEDFGSMFEESSIWEFPPDYPENLEISFRIEFVSPYSLRFKMETDCLKITEKCDCKIWDFETDESYIKYFSKNICMFIYYNPFNIIINNADGDIIFKTNNIKDSPCLRNCDPMPFCFIRNSEDLSMHFASSLSLSANEKIFGGGESFTSLNKRGQKMVLYTKDPHGVETPYMYKPVPFLMSSNGYGLYYNTTCPLTFDIGQENALANVAYLGENCLDLYVFFGTPKEILKSYTQITGRSPMPPLWSFGLWMSRISYNSEKEIREVAEQLRKYQIPCDVIHVDTGWFETDWRCDYRFSKTRFENPKKMIEDLKKEGFRISLWQLPYITPKNPLFKEVTENNYFVKDLNGNLSTHDAIIDFSNPQAVIWYKKLLKDLLCLGVSAIKVDFGEAAPLNGLYHSGKSGFYEHNLYPYRYNKAVFDITKEVTGENIIWARSAWAGSQKFPVHWGGDSDNTDNAMLASLRGGLSLGLCGFSFWSHDIGGFSKKTPEELYKRWLPFGMLTSHSRCHGEPPKEPWFYSDELLCIFRKSVELKYSLLPYIYKQSEICCANGYPLLRPLFFEFPDDYGSYLIEDEYMFGENLLVAPLFKANSISREVYLPTGKWVDYFTHDEYVGGKFTNIKTSRLPIILMVRKGSVIPCAKVERSTKFMNLSNAIYIKY